MHHRHINVSIYHARSRRATGCLAESLKYIGNQAASPGLTGGGALNRRRRRRLRRLRRPTSISRYRDVGVSELIEIPPRAMAQYCSPHPGPGHEHSGPLAEWTAHRPPGAGNRRSPPRERYHHHQNGARFGSGSPPPPPPLRTATALQRFQLSRLLSRRGHPVSQQPPACAHGADPEWGGRAGGISTMHLKNAVGVPDSSISIDSMYSRVFRALRRHTKGAEGAMWGGGGSKYMYTGIV